MSKILIIEDEPDISKVLNKRLSEAGFDVAVAADAYQGVELAHREKPDLIILDLMLPAGGGISVLKNLKYSAHVSSIPIVVLTGMKDEENKKKILEEGVRAYMEKPYNPDELIATIRNILLK